MTLVRDMFEEGDRILYYFYHKISFYKLFVLSKVMRNNLFRLFELLPVPVRRRCQQRGVLLSLLRNMVVDDLLNSTTNKDTRIHGEAIFLVEKFTKTVMDMNKRIKEFHESYTKEEFQ